MIILPAIDIKDGNCVRLFKGDFSTVEKVAADYMETAKGFEAAGASWIHMVDLDGAKEGRPVNQHIYEDVAAKTGLKVEVGGGIRSVETVKTYLDAGLDRVILGTAAVEDEAFLKQSVELYGEKIAVGVDIKDGYVAIKGWTENSALGAFDFCEKMQAIGVKTLICTDISKDGAMQGTNLALYRELSHRFSVNITASGGVSTIGDVENLRKMDLYGAIIGKAYYTGAIDLAQAIEVAK